MYHIEQCLISIEANPAITSRAGVISALRSLGLTDFSYVFMNMPDPRYPKVSSLLPAFATEEVQMNWTGNKGEVLLGQSISFMQSVGINAAAIMKESLAGKRILDFGCGYGRLLRLCYYFSDDVWGVDPWDVSIDLCKRAGITDNVFVSDYLPTSLPVPNNFDIAYAFSVFTHLSEKATVTALNAVHKHLSPGGLFCITIRPIEYWKNIYSRQPSEFIAQREAEHMSGFTFVPHNREAIDGDITYGDSSMTIDWLNNVCKGIGWEIMGVDRSLSDMLQRYVFLKKVAN